MKEKRKANIIFSKNGNGYTTIKISLPKPWIDILKWTIENKEAELILMEDGIFIKKV